MRNLLLESWMDSTVGRMSSKESRYSSNISFPVVKHVMNQHEKTPCSLCGEMVSKAAMSRHIEFKHTEQQNRKYKCTFCGKGFAQSQALKDHINTHTGEKPYMCKFCGAAFANMGSHRMHERTVHLGHKRDEKIWRRSERHGRKRT